MIAYIKTKQYYLPASRADLLSCCSMTSQNSLVSRPTAKDAIRSDKGAQSSLKFQNSLPIKNSNGAWNIAATLVNQLKDLSSLMLIKK